MHPSIATTGAAVTALVASPILLILGQHELELKIDRPRSQRGCAFFFFLFFFSPPLSIPLVCSTRRAKKKKKVKGYVAATT